MKFWEGAILVAGGLYLIGRMSRRLPSHPINQLANSATVNGTVSGYGPTVGTNTDGSSALVGGETLDPAPPLPNQMPWVPPVNSRPISVDTSCSDCGGVTSVANSPVLHSGAIISGLGTLDLPKPTLKPRPVIGRMSVRNIQ